MQYYHQKTLQALNCLLCAYKIEFQTIKRRKTVREMSECRFHHEEEMSCTYEKLSSAATSKPSIHEGIGLVVFIDVIF